MFRAWKAVDTLSYRLNKTERLRNGELVREAAFVKLRKPDSYYIAALEPKRGQEVIYVGRRDKARLVVHPGHFPDITLRLSVRSALATERQHHLVTHSGLQYTLDGLRRSLRAAQTAGDGSSVVYHGTAEVGGRACHVVELIAGRAKPKRVAAREGETLFDFAARVEQDAYVIYGANAEIDEPTDDLDAREYWVPAYYAGRSEWRVDAQTGLPLRVTFWDSRGRLYERYEYVGMKVNPPLTGRDFDPDNPDYDF
jgi:outer membrane lipoprotein-sorting protein